jgi:hypothetical protein
MIFHLKKNLLSFAKELLLKIGSSRSFAKVGYFSLAVFIMRPQAELKSAPD